MKDKKTKKNGLFLWSFGQVLKESPNLLEKSNLADIKFVELSAGIASKNLSDKTSKFEGKIMGINVSDKDTNQFGVSLKNVFLDFERNDLWKFGLVRNRDKSSISKDGEWVYLTDKENGIYPFSDTATFPNKNGETYVRAKAKLSVDVDTLGPQMNNHYIYANFEVSDNGSVLESLNQGSVSQTVPIYKAVNSSKKINIAIYNTVSVEETKAGNPVRKLQGKLTAKITYYPKSAEEPKTTTFSGEQFDIPHKGQVSGFLKIVVTA